MKKIRSVVAGLTLAFGLGAVASGAVATTTDWVSLAQTASLQQDKISASENAYDFAIKQQTDINQTKLDLEQNKITEQQFENKINYLNSNQYKRDVVFNLEGVTNSQKDNFRGREEQINKLKTASVINIGVGSSLFLLSASGFATESILIKKQNNNQENTL